MHHIQIHEGEITKTYCQTCQCPICHECLSAGHTRHRICTLKEEVESQGNQVSSFFILLIFMFNKVEKVEHMHHAFIIFWSKIMYTCHTNKTKMFDKDAYLAFVRRDAPYYLLIYRWNLLYLLCKKINKTMNEVMLDLIV